MNRMFGKSVAGVALCLPLLFSGCGKGELEQKGFDPAWTNRPAGVALAEVDRPLTNLAPEEVVVCVNGHLLRRKDFDIGLAMYRRIYEMRRNKAVGAGGDSTVESQVRRSRPSVISDFIRQAIMTDEAKRLGVELKPETLARYERNIAQSLRRSGKRLDELAEEMGGEAGVHFKELIRSQALADDLRSVAAKGSLDVTEKDLDEGFARLEAFNQRAAASNAVMRKLAFKAWDALKAGSNIVEVAKTYSPLDPEQGSCWNSFEAVDLEVLPALRRWVLSHHPGDFSMPMEVDDRISVVKLEKIVRGEELQDGLTYVLTRVAFPIYESAEIPGSREELREQIHKQRSLKFHQTFAKQLFEQAVVYYPNGTNLFPNPKRQARSPRRKPQPKGKPDAKTN
ncbi:MAG: hypothetical protein ACI4QD_00595 [Kiritimatiellia bacterium]